MVILVYYFETNLNKEQIIYRLSTFGDTGLNQIASSKDVLYKVSGDKLKLIKNTKYHKNPFHRFFYAKMKFNDNKTIIRGKFKLHPFVLLFSIVWLSLAIGMGGIMFLGGLLSVFSKDLEVGKTVLFIVVPPAMVFGFFGFLKFGRKKQEEELLEILKEKLELKQIEKMI